MLRKICILSGIECLGLIVPGAGEDLVTALQGGGNSPGCQNEHAQGEHDVANLVDEGVLRVEQGAGLRDSGLDGDSDLVWKLKRVKTRNTLRDSENSPVMI